MREMRGPAFADATALKRSGDARTRGHTSADWPTFYLGHPPTMWASADQLYCCNECRLTESREQEGE
jgi:hypothetical protein